MNFVKDTIKAALAVFLVMLLLDIVLAFWVVVIRNTVSGGPLIKGCLIVAFLFAFVGAIILGLWHALSVRKTRKGKEATEAGAEAKKNGETKGGEHG